MLMISQWILNIMIMMIIRRGICQKRFTSKILKFSSFTWENAYNAKFLANIQNGGCLTHIFEQIVSFYLLQYKFTPVILWKATKSQA